MPRNQWVRAGVKPSDSDKAAITAACDEFIADVLVPRFLPEIRPTQFNYPIAIYGKWHGNKFRFIQRFRSDRDDSFEPEFEAPFVRLEFFGRDRFDISYFRHTETWFRLHRNVSLREALRLIEEDGLLHPI
jgi:hypothetical protein